MPVPPPSTERGRWSATTAPAGVRSHVRTPSMPHALPPLPSGCGPSPTPQGDPSACTTALPIRPPTLPPWVGGCVLYHVLRTLVCSCRICSVDGLLPWPSCSPFPLLPSFEPLFSPLQVITVPAPFRQTRVGVRDGNRKRTAGRVHSPKLSHPPNGHEDWPFSTSFFPRALLPGPEVLPLRGCCPFSSFAWVRPANQLPPRAIACVSQWPQISHKVEQKESRI